MALTDQQYYNDSSNWGNNQFVLIKDVINNFMAFYVGESKVIDNVSRYDVLFHAKRGLQELHYDALRDIRALELDLPDDLQLELPKDFVRLVRLSWVDDRGRLHQMMVDNDTAMPTAYLQDNNFDIIFDSNGNATEGTSVVDNKRSQISDNETGTHKSLSDEMFGGRFGMLTNKSNVNGMYNIDKRLGVLRLSTEVKGKTIVIEYITDGLEGLEENEIKINKMAEDFLYKYIAHQIVSHKFGVQEYIVRRLKNDAFASMKNMKIRMMDIHPLDLAQALNGRNKWIK
jgi:hypothetical protein